MGSHNSKITKRQKDAAEEQIREEQQPVDYDTREYIVEIVVQKYCNGLEDDTNELFIPDYQREEAWDAKRQSRLVESVMLGLPIPYVFVADVRDPEDGEDLGRIEIVDGSQRIRALSNFLRNELQLQGLEKLTKLNGFYFEDLPLSRQRRFNRTSLRMIELTEKANEETRRDIFERLNTGSVVLTDMEKRRGISPGPLLELVEEVVKESLFCELCPFSKALKNRREPEEYALRFFAYLENYQDFQRSVSSFVNEFLENKNKTLSESERQNMRDEFMRTLEFVKEYYPNGFRKNDKAQRIYRVRFEAISVGTALALRENPDLIPSTISWLDSEEFKKLTTSDGSNSRPKVIARVEYVKNQLLGVVD